MGHGPGETQSEGWRLSVGGAVFCSEASVCGLFHEQMGPLLQQAGADAQNMHITVSDSR